MLDRWDSVPLSEEVSRLGFFLVKGRHNGGGGGGGGGGGAMAVERKDV